MTSAHYMQNTGGIDPSSPSLLQLPTTIISELIEPASSSPDVNSAQPESTQAATAAATATPSPRPRDSQVPASTNHIQAARGGDPIGNVGPPGMAAQYISVPDRQADASTGMVAVTATPVWTPTKVLLAGSISAVVFLAVLAMLLLSRRGRPSVSRNFGTVILGNDEQASRHHVRPRPRPTARAVIPVPELTVARVGAILDDDGTGPMGIDPETISAARRIALRLNDRRP